MKYLNYVKVFLIALFAIAMLVLALPEFSFKIGSETFTYPSVGFSKIGIGKDFPSFTQGRDVFSTTEYKYTLDFGSAEISQDDKKATLKNVVERVQNRLNYVAFTDIKVEGKVAGENYYVILDIPHYYNNTSLYADMLLTKGEITFSSLQFDGEGSFTELALDFDETDIIKVTSANNFEFSQQVTDRQTGAIVKSTQNQPGSILKLDFREERTVDLNQISNFVGYINQLSSGSPYLTNMSIDGLMSFELIYDDIEGSQLFAIPATAETQKEVDDSIKIARAIFQEAEPMSSELTFESEKSLVPSYNPEGGSFIAGMFIIAFIAISIYLYTQFAKRKSLAIILLASIQILTAVNILKIVGVPISTGLIIGFVVAMILSISGFVIKINSEVLEELKVALTYAYIISALAAIAVLRLNMNMGVISDILLVVICNSISGAFISFFFSHSIFRNLKLIK